MKKRLLRGFWKGLIVQLKLLFYLFSETKRFFFLNLIKVINLLNIYLSKFYCNCKTTCQVFMVILVTAHRIVAISRYRQLPRRKIDFILAYVHVDSLLKYILKCCKIFCMRLHKILCRNWPWLTVYVCSR